MDVDAMRQGMAAGEFFLEYLPGGLARSRPRGEALAAPRRPSGVVLPREFVPLAKVRLFSGELCYWVIETVASVAVWLRSNLRFSLSINVSPEILDEAVFVMPRTIGLSDLFPQLILEITRMLFPILIGLKALDGHHAGGRASQSTM